MELLVLLLFVGCESEGSVRFYPSPPVTVFYGTVEFKCPELRKPGCISNFMRAALWTIMYPAVHYIAPNPESEDSSGIRCGAPLNHQEKFRPTAVPIPGRVSGVPSSQNYLYSSG